MRPLETLLSCFTDPFLSDIVIKALLVGIPIALCAALLGVTLVLKRFSMIGDGLSHVGFGALAIATLLNLEGGNNRTTTLLISLPIVIVAAFFLLRLSQNSKIGGDAAVALVSTGAIAIGYLIFTASGTGSPADVCSSLFGKSTLLVLSDSMMALSIGISIVVVAMYLLCYSKIFSITFDENFAQATGLNTSWYSTLLALLTAVTIVIGMQIVGAVMISGLIVFPTLTAMRLSKSFRGVVIWSGVISVACYIIGFFASTILDLPTGPSVICINSFVFSVIAIVRRRMVA